MNDLIRKQLEKVTATKIDIDVNAKKIVIPKTIKVLNTSLKKDQIYDIKLKPSILNPATDSSLADNWNNGIIPEYDSYTVEVVANLANMIKVNGVAIENNSSQFCGWLPHDSFEVIKRY